ncbi:MAG: hypothetical protein KGQ67_11550 [Betaproteobacteria bacterium]|nr:hypothetical protein [Betaproteobacteria bacterium]
MPPQLSNPCRRGCVARRQRGLSVASVLAGLAVVAILAVITMPSYASYTRRVYISQGLELAMPAKAAATEYYELSKAKPKASRPPIAMSLPEGADPGPPPLPEPELVVSWPSRQVEAVYRADALVLVKYATAVDPAGLKRFYLVLRPSGGATGTVWSCLSDEAARGVLTAAKYAIPDADPMPDSLASSVCR